MTDPTSRQRAGHVDRTVTFKQEETSGHEFQSGLDTKTDKLTDRQLQCDSDSEDQTMTQRLAERLLGFLSSSRKIPG
jgi:hypothetical protein